MAKHIYWIIFIFCLLPFSLYAQGIWNHYYYNDGVVFSMCAQGNNIWWSQNLQDGVVRYSKSDGKQTLYTVKDGLVNGTVRAIVSDKQGVVWFGTAEGVSSFDGSEWKSYTTGDGLLSNDVTAITVDGNNIKWFGTKSGVSLFDGKSWRSYTPADGLADSTVSCIYADVKGTIWIGTNGKGVSRFDGKAWETFTTRDGVVSDSVNCIAGESNGTIWLATNAGASRFDGVFWKSYTVDTGLAGNEIFGVAVDSNDVKWFAIKKGVQRFDGVSWKLYADVDGLGNTWWSQSVIVDEDNTVWVGPDISSFDGNEWLTYTPILSARAVAVDQNNTKWFGYPVSNGAVSSKAFGWKRHTIKEGAVPPGPISIAVDRNNVKWFATFGSGIYSFDGTEWKEFSSSNGEFDDSLLRAAYHVAVDSANVKWFTTGVPQPGDFWMGEGVLSFDGTRWKHYSTADGMVDNVVMSVAVDHDNVKWFGTDGKGVSSFDGENWISYTPDMLIGKRVPSIAVDHNNVKWFGTEGNGGGIYSFDGKIWTSYSIEGLKWSTINSLCVDLNNLLWVGTYSGQGVWSFDGSEWKQNIPDILSEKVPNYMVNDIAVDNDNIKWFVANGFISSYDDRVQTRVEEISVPMSFSILSNYPNPFNPFTTLSFSLLAPGRANFAIYSITGQRVRTLLSGPISDGTHSIVWDGRDDFGKPVSSGVYLSRLTVGKRTATGKMLLMR